MSQWAACRRRSLLILLAVARDQVETIKKSVDGTPVYRVRVWDPAL